MKKLIVLIIFCILCSGCGKENKTIIVNVYDNHDKIDEKTNTYEDVSTSEYDEKTVIQENETFIKDSNVNNSISDSSTDIITEEIKEESKLNKIKSWYQSNKDDIKDISDDILENDKKTLMNLYDNARSWYDDNKEELNSSVNNVYKGDKSTLKDLYDKFAN